MKSSDRTPVGGRAVFLDRDGVLIADVDHLVASEQIRVLRRVPDALTRLRAAGWRLIIATNQSVVARGLITEERLEEIHQVLRTRLRARGADIDAVYYCPHHPEGRVAAYRRECSCRKPNPGMLLQAAKDWRLDIARSVIVGDAPSDLEAGRRAGCHTVMIRSGEIEGGQGARRGTGPVQTGLGRGGVAPEVNESARLLPPDYVAGDLWGAAEWILMHLGKD